MDSCCTCPTLWLDGAHNTELTVGSSVCIVTWWSAVKHSATKAGVKSCSSKGKLLSTNNGRALLPYPKGLLFYSLMTTCQRLHTASLSANDTSSTIRSAGSYGLSGRAVSWTCFRAFWSRTQTKLAAFQDPCYLGKKHTQVKNVISPESKQAHNTVLLSWCQERTDAITYPSPLKESLWMPHTPGLLEVSLRPLNCGWIYFSFSGANMCYQQIQSSCYLLFTLSNQHNVINIVNQYGILYMRQINKIPLD